MTPDQRFELTHPFRALYWRARIALLAMRWVPRLNLGDEVETATGEKWTLVQGVCAPRWEMSRGNHEAGTYQRIELHSRDFRKVRSLRNYARSFRSGWRFYMTSWYRIWMREGVKPWMRGCSIWARGDQ